MRRPAFALASALATFGVLAACGGDGVPLTSSSAGSGGQGGESSSEGGNAQPTTGGSTASNASGSTSATPTSSSGGAGPGSGAGGPGSGAGGPGAGGSGEGGAGAGGSEGWPECLIENFGGAEKSILDVWSDDPAASTVYWLPDVVVTAVSGGACVEGSFCQIFVQQQESFTGIADASQQAIRVLVAPEVASYFVGIGVGDRVDLGGEAYRDTTDARNELRFFVRASAPGCMTIVAAGDPQPVDVTLPDLTREAYEETMGPVFVRLTTVSGRPHQPNELFALWDSEMGPDDGGIETVTNVSPFFIPGSVFVALVPEVIVDFATVTGVYGQFYRTETMAKYETIYIRSMGDAPFVE